MQIGQGLHLGNRAGRTVSGGKKNLLQLTKDSFEIVTKNQGGGSLGDISQRTQKHCGLFKRKRKTREVEKKDQPGTSRGGNSTTFAKREEKRESNLLELKNVV